MANTKNFKVKNGIQPTVYHEGVGTVTSGTTGGNLSTISYDSKSFSVATQESTPQGIAISSDGTKFYVIGGGTDRVFEYDLSTAYDISTASYNSVSFLVSGQDTASRDLFFKPDGTKMYIIGTSSDSIHQYALSTAWDLSTASYESKSLSVNSEENFPNGLSFNADGTSAYIVGQTNDTVYQYTLSTAWDVSTGSYSSKSFSVASQETAPHAVAFTAGGRYMYVSGNVADEVFQYTLSTLYDVSTASYNSVSYDFSAQGADPQGIALTADNTKMYILDTTGGVVYQYSTTMASATLDMSTGTVFEVTPTADTQIGLSNPASSGTVSAATLLLDGAASNTYDLDNASYDDLSSNFTSKDSDVRNFNFSADGNYLFIPGGFTDTVYRYSLATPWDLTTVTDDSNSKDTSAQATSAMDVWFKPDGTIMYVSDNNTSAIYQYTLSTAYDLSTASYASKSLSVSSQGLYVRGMAINDDGTKFYAYSDNSSTIYQYNATTAYDISTASYASKSFNPSSDAPAPTGGISFNSDGTELFVGGASADAIYKFDLSTAYDISTASYSGVSFTVGNSILTPHCVRFGNSGAKMFVIDSTNDTIYQYSSASAASITYDTAIKFAGGTAPDSPAVGDTDVLTFTTRDSGTTYNGILAIDGAK